MAATGNEVVKLSQLKIVIDNIIENGLSVFKNKKTAGEFYKSDEMPSSTDVGKFDGYLYATRVYNAVWNDYAELFHSKEKIEPGKIAYVDDDGDLVSSGVPNRAIGVVTDRYGHLLGGHGDPNEDGYLPISLAGRVPVAIASHVEVGDMLISDSHGFAQKASFDDFGKIIGKCCGPDPDGREGYVEMLVVIG